MLRLLLIPLLAFAAIQRPKPLPVPAKDNEELAAMGRRSDEMLATGKVQELQREAPAQRAKILKMIEEDQIGTANDFVRASKLYDDSSGWFEVRRAQHEYALMALALGDREAASNLRRTWDGLLMSMGHRPRFLKPVPEFEMFQNLVSIPLPPTLALVFTDAEAARDAAKGKDNEEIKKLEVEDQAFRTGPIDVAKIREGMKADTARRARVKELLEKGIPKTARDFGSLGLVMQHGQDFDDFQLAHELAMASVILGNPDPWLIPATYDRMMLSEGHRQRFGSQFNQNGMQAIATEAINDRMRLQFGLPKLDDLRAREKEILKRSFGGG